MLEIEFKAKLRESKSPLIPSGFEKMDKLQEIDIYYQAPDRDFFQSNEALRIRRQIRAQKEYFYLTYKGPRLDKISNSRPEIETAVEDGQSLSKILQTLGYRALFRVSKERIFYLGQGEWSEVKLYLDQVEGLGSFLEVEYLAAQDLKDKEKERIQKKLLSLLDEMKIPRSSLVRKSYLELLNQEATS